MPKDATKISVSEPLSVVIQWDKPYVMMYVPFPDESQMLYLCCITNKDVIFNECTEHSTQHFMLDVFMISHYWPKRRQ